MPSWWAANGVDRAKGGFVEQMTLDGRGAGVAFQRTRVTARHIYVLSHAHMLGFDKGADITRPGVEFLTARTWQGLDKGFARRLTRESDILDPDLYDTAFALFAIA